MRDEQSPQHNGNRINRRIISKYDAHFLAPYLLCTPSFSTYVRYACSEMKGYNLFYPAQLPIRSMQLRIDRPEIDQRPEGIENEGT